MNLSKRLALGVAIGWILASGHLMAEESARNATLVDPSAEIPTLSHWRKANPAAKGRWARELLRRRASLFARHIPKDAAITPERLVQVVDTAAGDAERDSGGVWEYSNLRPSERLALPPEAAAARLLRLHPPRTSLPKAAREDTTGLHTTIDLETRFHGMYRQDREDDVTRYIEFVDGWLRAHKLPKDRVHQLIEHSLWRYEYRTQFYVAFLDCLARSFAAKKIIVSEPLRERALQFLWSSRWGYNPIKYALNHLTAAARRERWRNGTIIEAPVPTLETLRRRFEEHDATVQNLALARLALEDYAKGIGPEKIQYGAETRREGPTRLLFPADSRVRLVNPRIGNGILVQAGETGAVLDAGESGGDRWVILRLDRMSDDRRRALWRRQGLFVVRFPSAVRVADYLERLR